MACFQAGSREFIPNPCSKHQPLQVTARQLVMSEILGITAFAATARPIEGPF
jgi:hypothetical protein